MDQLYQIPCSSTDLLKSVLELKANPSPSGMCDRLCFINIDVISSASPYSSRLVLLGDSESKFWQIYLIFFLDGKQRSWLYLDWSIFDIRGMNLSI